METTELMTINQENALEVFTGDKLPEYLKAIKEDALNFVADPDTATGRKQIASKAHSIAKEKVRIDNIGKVLVADWKAKSYMVDEARKKTRDFMDDVKKEVRLPLTEYEDAKKAVEEAERQAIKKEMEWEEALVEDDFFNRKKEVERKEAELKAQEEERLAKEKALQAEIDQKNREERIKLEAKEKAEREAADKIEALKQVQRDKVAKELAEKERIEEEKREAQRLADRKAANLNHQRKINREALEGFVDHGLTEELAKNIITLIAKGEIKHISIKY